MLRPHWFLHKDPSSQHFLVKPGAIGDYVYQNTSFDRMLRHVRRTATAGQVVHRFGCGVTGAGHRVKEGDYTVEVYRSGQRIRRASDMDTVETMRELGLQFVHPLAVRPGAAPESLYYYMMNIGDYVRMSDPSYSESGRAMGIALAFNGGVANPCSSLRTHLARMGASWDFMNALGMRRPPTVLPAGTAVTLSADPGTGWWVVRNPGITETFTWLPGVEAGMSDLVPPTSGAGNHSAVDIDNEEFLQDPDFEYIDDTACSIPQDIWSEELLDSPEIIHLGDLYSLDQGRTWEINVDAGQPSVEFGPNARVRRMNPKYRFRVPEERVMYGDILMSRLLVDATRCVSYADIGSSVYEWGLVVTRSDLWEPRNLSCARELGLKFASFRYLDSSDVVCAGDVHTSVGMVLVNPIPGKAYDRREFIRPIGYKQELEARPDPLDPSSLPAGYIHYPHAFGMHPNADTLLWVGHERVVDFYLDSTGPLPPHISALIVGKELVGDTRDIVHRSYVGSVAMIRRVDVCDFAIQQSDNFLILNIHGLMVIHGALSMHNRGAMLHTAIGYFHPYLFLINGQEKIVYVSSNIEPNDIVTRLEAGLGDMLGVCNGFVGANIHVPLGSCPGVINSYGRKVQLCD